MSWLDEIEDEATLALEGDEAFTEGYMDDLRMARVIREQAASSPLLRNIYTSLFMSEARNEGLPPQIQYWLQEIPKYLDSLSPDSKEVLNESTTPRST